VLVEVSSTSGLTRCTETVYLMLHLYLMQVKVKVYLMQVKVYLMQVKVYLMQVKVYLMQVKVLILCSLSTSESSPRVINMRKKSIDQSGATGIESTARV